MTIKINTAADAGRFLGKVSAADPARGKSGVVISVSNSDGQASSHNDLNDYMRKANRKLLLSPTGPK